MISIRPYVSIQEGIIASAPVMLDSLLKGLIVGPAMDEFHSISESFNFSALNSVTIAELNDQIGDKGKYFKMAGAREGSTVDVNSIEWGASIAKFLFDFGDNDLKGHVKDKDHKYIFIQETGEDGQASESDLIDQGLQKGDTLRVHDPDDDSKFTDIVIRDFDRDGDDLSILLWDEIPYDVDETKSLKADVVKEFKDVELAQKDYSYSSAAYSGTDVLIKGDGKLYLTYFVYKPTDKDADLNNIVVSTTNMVIPNYSENALTVKVFDGFLNNFFDAYRTDLENQILTVNYSNYRELLGKPSKKNKLGTALHLIAQEVPGFEIKVMPTMRDDLESYSKVFDSLVNVEDFYSLTPLTSDKKVIGLLNKFTEQVSSGEISNFKMGVASIKMPIITKKLETSSYNVEDNDDGTYTITLDNGGFSNSDTRVGDYIFGNKDIELADEEYYDDIGETYSGKAVAKIQDVVTDKKIIVTPIIEGLKVDEVLDGQDLVVAKLNTKNEIKKIIKEYPESFNNMHMVLVFPDKFVKDNKVYAGYYGAAVIQAVMAHLPPQQGLSNMAITVFDRVINSSYYFQESELDEIASAGIMVISQKSFNSYPYIIRQLTTNMNSIEEMEVSKVRCLDYVAIQIKQSVDGYVGKRNVTHDNKDEILQKIEVLLKGIIKDTSNILLGPIILSYSNLVVEIDTNEVGAIEGSVEVVTPTSLNAIKLGVKSKSK